MSNYARTLLAAGAVVCGLLGSSAAGALTFNHDLPGTAIPSQNPRYPNVATLTLTQTLDGVQFVLDPNQASPGFGASSFVERLDFVYAGSVLDSGGFAQVWRGSEPLRSLREPQSPGACASWGSYDACGGGCMAAKFFTGLPLAGPEPECVFGNGARQLATVTSAGGVTTGGVESGPTHSSSTLTICAEATAMPS